MKTLQVKMNDIDKEKLQTIQSLKPQLVFAFGSPKWFKDKSLLPFLKELKDVHTIGCSTSGEIISEGIQEDSLVLTGVHFENDMEIKQASAQLDSPSKIEKAGEELGKKLNSENLKFVFVLGLGVNFNGSALIRGMKKHLGKNVVITGGLAGESLEIGYGSIGGWQPFGPVRRATKAEGNILYQIDGQPALSIYKKYLGEKANDLPASCLLYPLALLDKNNPKSIGLIRTLLNLDKKNEALILAGDIPQDSLLQLMHSRVDGLIQGAKKAAEQAFHMTSHQNSPPEDSLAILISCVGRKLAMGEETEEEIFSIKDVLGPSSTLSGFYSYGEIAPFHKLEDCRLHNQTMTVTYLKEKKSA